MLKNWLSRYRARYPRSLVYMLQASEYDMYDYLEWLNRTKNFARIEQRKKLSKTPKAVALLASAWIIVALLFVLAIFMLSFGATPVKYILALFVLCAAPYAIAYGLVIPLLMIKIAEWPVQYLLLRQTKRRLKTHKGIKIAIAGSFGKTSMREILKTVLGEGKKVAAPPESYNTPLGISRFVKNLKGNEEVLIFELGEYRPGDVRKLCELIKPEWGVITGVNEAHLKKFKTLGKTAETIFELATWLHHAPSGVLLRGKPLYVNGENKLAKENASAEHILYNREGVGGWEVQNPATGLTGTSFTLVKNGERRVFTSKLLGLHQIGPLVAAIDIAARLGVPDETIQKGVAKTAPFPHRLEQKTDASGVIILDDSYNGNPDGVKAVIEFLASLKEHRRFYVTPGLVEMGPRREAVHRDIGKRLARAGIEKVVLIKNSVTGYIEQGLTESGYGGEVIRFDDALSAMKALPHLTVKGDVVLLQNDWPDQYQ